MSVLRHLMTATSTITAAAGLLLAGPLAGHAIAAGRLDPTPQPVVAASAAAKAGTSGSIVFVRKHNVWIARGDGSHARRVTKDGTATRPYRSPSESDRGVIAAARGSLIVRMSQRGHVLNRINPPRLYNSAGEPMDGTVNEVALSPNGRTIAWTYVRYSCPIGADCLTRFATGYTAASHRARAGRSTFYRAPSWVGNGRTLQTGGYRSQVMLQDLHAGAQHWFDDSDYAFPSTDLADGELSRDGRWLAEIRGYQATSSIIWYRVTGSARSGRPPAVPQYSCYTNGEPKHASPTWSPDSTALAWAAADGIWVKRDAAHCSVQPKLLIRGGSAPDWSPAKLR